ncbi:hypothetical protein N7463_008658 [Penicillium fimorum]|uniref:Short-chain dehydrogenase/reductase SDR n=1 Tax=Penicillium fimorum TaxID=1882269 RepID=A0A9W9XPB3_9EURO|nr:hypothetical protein N7463_008658 [Penicillium fimorum]
MAATKPLIPITGANQGLGFATAQQLASGGKYDLLIGARSQEKAEEDESITVAAKFVEEHFGSLDILINNTGINRSLGQIGIAYSPTSEYSAKIWELSVYRSGKSAINMINAVDAVSLEKENILSVLAAPGFCRTNFGGGNGVKSAEEGAQLIVRAAIEGTPKELFGKLVADENTLVGFGW